MALSPEVKKALRNARKLEKKHIVTKSEVKQEAAEITKLSDQLRHLLSKVWYLQGARRKK